MLTTPDCVDEIGPTSKVKEIYKGSHPEMAEGDGIRKPKRKGAGTKVDFRAGKKAGGRGGLTAGCPVAVFPSVLRSCVSWFRVDSSTSFRENLPFLENAVLLAMLQLFYSFLFDSASVLRTIILINCESTQENTKSRKSALTSSHHHISSLVKTF